jgi:hypothetical protein
LNVRVLLQPALHVRRGMARAASRTNADEELGTPGWLTPTAASRSVCHGSDRETVHAGDRRPQAPPGRGGNDSSWTNPRDSLSWPTIFFRPVDPGRHGPRRIHPAETSRHLHAVARSGRGATGEVLAITTAVYSHWAGARTANGAPGTVAWAILAVLLVISAIGGWAVSAAEVAELEALWRESRRRRRAGTD